MQLTAVPPTTSRPAATGIAGASVDRRLRTARTLTSLTLLFTLAAAAAGLFVPGLYRDPAAIVPAMRGQDLLTLAVLPLVALAMVRAARGSACWTIVWIALLGYLLYTYVGAAFAYAFNELSILYIALFSLIVASLVALIAAIDARAIAHAFGASAPVRSTSGFLVIVAAMVAIPELAQMVPFYTEGTIPEIITRADAPTSFIYAMDLGVVVPLCLLGARWLAARRPAGFIVAGCMLVKGASMGIALMSMTLFSAMAGYAVEVGLTIVYAAIAAGSLGMSWWFLRGCR